MRISNLSKWGRVALIVAIGLVLSSHTSAVLPEIIGVIKADTTNVLFGERMAALRHQPGNRTDLVVYNGWSGTYVYRGGMNFDTLPFLKFDATGGPYSEVGDVNADGFDDIAMINRSSIPRKASLYVGGPSLDTVRDLWFGLDTLYANSYSIFEIGDVDGDGHRELVSSGSEGPFGSQRVVLLFDIELGTDTVPSLVIHPVGISPTVYGGFGSGSAQLAAGDFNNDSAIDLAIGLSMQGTASRCGEVWIYYGGPMFDTVPDLRIKRPSADSGDCSLFGSHVICPDDLNGDGFDDIVVSGGDADTTVFVFFGNTLMDTLPDLVFNRVAPQLRSAGDINGDGYPDIIMALPNPYSGGTVWLYYGGPSMDGVPDITIHSWELGLPFTAGFGMGITGIGDFNGDGVDDFAFTLYDAETRGHVYIFSGTKSTDVTIDQERKLPTDYSLEPNYPNPFNGTTKIRFSLPHRSSVILKITDVLGREVKVIDKGELGAGSYTATWDAGRVSSGVYFCVLEANGVKLTQKMVLLK